ncbi:enolase C-terminal domain-like protein [Streptomonospora nanhaiensis]|uniref:O-succinylbenzoate synthase n=1 Tax=Streptomonospora nanhaiensis TaxID=1323731 RepID=A0A853BIB3_9ACTN|nr:enolase C-terminal domain-like protein [Streptomonospora nanhaiensis]MBV2362322.1 O-succinylbenzoate synthase [Streptomonospora nanhaiensis]NYI95023.1 O-succinylbenzoate synthase [Streptomonospora nanhaiensis]
MSRTEPAILTRVAGVDATLVRLPLAHRSRGAVQTRQEFSRHALVRVVDERGRTGWGEVPQADPERWRALVEDYAPALLGHSWHRPTETEAAWAGLAWQPAVAAALDTACWDLWSRRRGTPLSHALGGDRTAFTAGTTVRRQPSEESLVREVNRQVGAGFRRVRLEIGPGWDIDVVRTVQESFPFLVLQADAGGRYTEDPAHLRALRALDDYGLAAIEEPFGGGDLAAHARLRRDLRTPVALSTTVDSLETLDRAIAMEAAGALSLRPARLGGLTPARRAHDRAVDAGWAVWCGADAESGLGSAAIAALASLPGVTLPSEMPGAGGRFARDTVRPSVRAHEGITPIPLTRPGLGYEIDWKQLRGLTVESVVLGPAG